MQYAEPAVNPLLVPIQHARLVRAARTLRRMSRKFSTARWTGSQSLALRRAGSRPCAVGASSVVPSSSVASLRTAEVSVGASATAGTAVASRGLRGASCSVIGAGSAVGSSSFRVFSESSSCAGRRIAANRCCTFNHTSTMTRCPPMRSSSKLVPMQSSPHPNVS